jgi:hypothetical protein
MISNNPCDKCAGTCDGCVYKRITEALEAIATSLATLAERQESTSTLAESVKLYTPERA